MTRNMLEVNAAKVERLSADLQKAKLSGVQSFRGTRGSEAGSTRRKLAAEHEVLPGDLVLRGLWVRAELCFQAILLGMPHREEQRA